MPLAIVTWVLLRLVAATKSEIPMSNLSITISFVIIWGIALWMLNKEYNMRAYDITIALPSVDAAEEAPKLISTTIQTDITLKEGQTIHVVDLEGKRGDGKLRILTDEQASEFTTDLDASVVREKQNETEVTASWFQILNSFFIIAFAPSLQPYVGESLNPSAPVKFGMGLILLGFGFGALAIASRGIARSYRRRKSACGG